MMATIIIRGMQEKYTLSYGFYDARKNVFKGTIMPSQHIGGALGDAL